MVRRKSVSCIYCQRGDGKVSNVGWDFSIEKELSCQSKQEVRSTLYFWQISMYFSVFAAFLNEEKKKHGEMHWRNILYVFFVF